MKQLDCSFGVSVKMELSISTPFSPFSDQNAVDINKVYTFSLNSCPEYYFSMFLSYLTYTHILQPHHFKDN